MLILSGCKDSDFFYEMAEKEAWGKEVPQISREGIVSAWYLNIDTIVLLTEKALYYSTDDFASYQRIEENNDMEGDFRSFGGNFFGFYDYKSDLFKMSLFNPNLEYNNFYHWIDYFSTYYISDSIYYGEPKAYGAPGPVGRLPWSCHWAWTNGQELPEETRHEARVRAATRKSAFGLVED